jgi:hypothetical protein
MGSVQSKGCGPVEPSSGEEVAGPHSGASSGRMLRVVGELSDESLGRLRDEPVVWCSTLREDGSPHLTPVWFLFVDGVWWICTEARNRKVRNVEHDPRVALALPSGTAPLVAEGRATLHRHDFPAHVVAGFARKYGWDIAPSGDGGAALVLFEIPTSRWLLDGSA